MPLHWLIVGVAGSLQWAPDFILYPNYNGANAGEFKDLGSAASRIIEETIIHGGTD